MINIEGKVVRNQSIKGSVDKTQQLNGKMQSNVGGVKYYEELPDKPSINGVELVGNKTLDDLNIQSKGDFATKESAGVIKVGENLSIEEGVLSVETTNNAEEDNTKPMTSAGVYIQLGNINVLLEKI